MLLLCEQHADQLDMFLSGGSAGPFVSGVAPSLVTLSDLAR